jgi:acyl-CoA hydrolase
MEWIDVTAAVEARRHAGSDVVTAAVDALEFIAPVALNDTLVLEAEVTWTGRTSLEVRVETFREHLDGERVLVNRAYLVCCC